MDGLGAFSSGSYEASKSDGADGGRAGNGATGHFNHHDGFSASAGHESADLVDMESLEGRSDQPQQLADLVFEAICKDIEEKPTSKGSQAFRDKVFENCSPQEISLRNVRMGASGAAALTKAMLPLPVRKLDLAMNSLGDESVPAIARAILNIPTLKHVNLASNSIGLAGVMEISKCLGTLLSLDLSSVPGFPRPNNVDGAACAALSRALCRPSSLTSLSLSGNPIGAGTSGSKATELLAVMLTKYSRTLDALNLANTELGTRGGATIMAALAHNRSLRHLTLAGNGIGPDIGKAVEVVLRVNHVLCGLNLAHNPLGAAIPRFSDALAANGSIVVLDLSDVAAGDDGAHELANVLVSNRSITSLLLANNGITERGGQIIAQALYHNPVLTSLDLSGNPIKDAAAVELAKVLAVSATLITLDLSSCKISDEGACHLFSAIASNPNTALRKLRLHNNFISGASGDAILDALYRNRSLVTVDLGGNQLDHVRLSKLKALGQRNLAAIREIEPRRLRAAIQRLRGQQIKLRKAEALLQTYRATIADTQAKIDEVEQEKARFLKNQQERRAEIRQQIQKEQDAIAEANKKLSEKQHELATVEKQYGDRLAEMQLALDNETETRKTIERDLATVRKDLEEAIRQRPNKVEDLKKQIDSVKAEKGAFNKQLVHVRKELTKLKQAYEEGKPVSYLVEQAKGLLLHNAVIEEAQRRAQSAAAPAAARDELDEL